MPIIKSLGFDPLWFGAILLLNMQMATKHLISAWTKGTRLRLLGLGLLAISLAALLPVTVSFAQTVSFGPATNFAVGGSPRPVAIGDTIYLLDPIEPEWEETDVVVPGASDWVATTTGIYTMADGTLTELISEAEVVPGQLDGARAPLRVLAPPQMRREESRSVEGCRRRKA